MSPAPESRDRAALLAALHAVVGGDALLTRPDELAPYVTDWRGRFTGSAHCVVRPRDRDQVAAVVRVCADHCAPVLPQGGNTSMSGGSVPFPATQFEPPVIVNLGRLRTIRRVDTANNSLEAEAGCILADIQRAAADGGRLYPVSFGAEGSAQIGGTLATNAGGTGVLRYGNTRENVLGLEVVLPDGRIWSGLRALRKDNTGYDLKHLFIGSEGTLGIITAVTLKLHPLPTARAVAWLAPTGLDAALAVLGRVQQHCGSQLSAFEILNRTQLDHAFAHVPGLREPLDQPAPWNLLVELSDTSSDEALRAALEKALADMLEEGLIVDAAVATSDAQCAAMWKIRHSVSEGNKKSGMSVVFDTAVPVSNVPAFITRSMHAVSQGYPSSSIAVVGHLGDGNIHFVPVFDAAAWARLPDADAVLKALREEIYEIATSLGGTYSAEHGVGRTLLAEMSRYKSPVELALMRTIKRALDPDGRFNPGKVLPAPDMVGR